MLDTVSLLDTPKRVKLQEKSQTLRAALKSFEHSFASEHGRKPKQNEIKNDVSIAGKYKEYRRIQDVLAGKIAYEKLSEQRSKPVASTGCSVALRNARPKSISNCSSGFCRW